MDTISINKNAIEYQQSIYSRVKEFCEPLNHYLGISLFIYSKFFQDGRYLLITNDLKLNLNYMENVTYANIFYQNHLNCNTSYDCILWPSTPQNDCIKTFFDHGYWHGLSLVINQSEEFIEMTCFLSDKDNPSINNLYYNNPFVLEKFTKCFTKKFAKEIEVFSNNKTLATLSQGIDLYIPPKNIDNDKESIQSFLKAIGYSQGRFELNDKLVKITLSELECLELLAQGCNIKEIARSSSRGTRTVETLLNRVKAKTGACYKSDLIKLCREKLWM